MKKFIIMMMLFAPMAVMAQKFGHVDSQSIMTTLPEIAKINGELQATAQQFENELKSMNDELQRKADEYEKAKATMNATTQKETEASLMEMNEKIRQTGTPEAAAGKDGSSISEGTDSYPERR